MILVEIINLYKKQTELINLSSVCPQSETETFICLGLFYQSPPNRPLI
jgi:hypothetical protein